MLAACAVGVAAPPLAVAQRVPPPPLTTSGPAVGPYERARRLVEQGQGALGRAVADSLVAASPPGSPALAEALWWRASLSADGARAEADLRRIIDEFTNSPRVGDATVRIAQLDISRDRPDMAEPTLARLVRERPDDPARAQAAYWLARARLELGDTRGGCTALADAATWARSSETFTRQQVAELRGRLPACDPASVVSVMSPAPRGSAPPATRAAAQPVPQPTPQTVAEAPPRAAVPPNATPTVSPAPTAATTAATSRSAPMSAPASASTFGAAARIDSIEAAELRRRNATAEVRRTAPPAAAPAPPVRSAASASTASASTTNASSSSVSSAGVSSTVAPVAEPKPAPKPAPTGAPPAVLPGAASAAPAPAARAEARGNFAVQVAAYNQRDPAESLAARLRGRGLDARATGSVAPFRVKIGRYPTRAAAAAARVTFAGQGLAGFVTDAGGEAAEPPNGAPARRP